jgi:hypothetical protein
MAMLVRTYLGGGTSDDGQSTPGIGLRARAQAGIQVTVASLTNQMHHVMAAGNDPAQRRTLDAELTRLHADVDAARTQLKALGEDAAAIDDWLTRIG